jgi:hypothetical protein
MDISSSSAYAAKRNPYYILLPINSLKKQMILDQIKCHKL